MLYPCVKTPAVFYDIESILWVEFNICDVLFRVKFAGDLKLFASFLLAEGIVSIIEYYYYRLGDMNSLATPDLCSLGFFSDNVNRLGYSPSAADYCG